MAVLVAVFYLALPSLNLKTAIYRLICIPLGASPVRGYQR